MDLRDKMDIVAEGISKEDPIIIEGFLEPYLEWKSENEPKLFEALFKKYEKKLSLKKFKQILGRLILIYIT